MKVQFGSPDIDADALGTEISHILRSGWVSIGEYVEALEDSFKERFGVKHAIGTNCATTGLIIALKSAGWTWRDTVNMPAFTWPSTLYAVDCIGANPVFHDIDPDTWLMKEIPSNHFTKLLLVDTFGSMAEHFEGFDKKDTIIDAAHGYGNKFLGKRALAEVVSLSFTKVVTGMEGGMILTDDDELAETAVELRRLSGRMGEINALVALKSIDGYKERHDKVWAVIMKYVQHLTVPYTSQKIPNFTNHSVFSLRFESTAVRDAIRIALERGGIETKVYHDPLHRGLPETEKLYGTILSIPTHADTIAHQDDIIEIINTAGHGAKTPGKDFLTR